MDYQTGMQDSAQAGIEDFNEISQKRPRCIVRESLLMMSAQKVTSLCGETCRPTENVHRRAGSEMLIIQAA